MLWVAVFVALGVATVVVLGGLTWRLWRQVRDFGRQVSAAGERIARATDELQRVTPPTPRP